MKERSIAKSSVVALALVAICGAKAFFSIPSIRSITNSKNEQLQSSSSSSSSSSGAESYHIPPISASLPSSSSASNDSLQLRSSRRLSDALPDGGCKITWPIKPPPGVQITYAASYPGCGARMTWNLVEALTGLWTGDDWNNNGRGDEVVTVKTHYPQSNGILVDFDDRIQRGFIVIRNPMKSIPSFFNHIYEMRNHLPVHSERAPLEEWVKWRDHYLDEEIAEYKKFIIYWMDRYSPENRLLITYEGLTDDLIGAEVAKGLNAFLAQAQGSNTIDNDSVPCVWKAVVKNQPPAEQAKQIAKLQEQAVEPKQENKRGRDRGQRGGGNNDQEQQQDDSSSQQQLQDDSSSQQQQQDDSSSQQGQQQQGQQQPLSAIELASLQQQGGQSSGGFDQQQQQSSGGFDQQQQQQSPGGFDQQQQQQQQSPGGFDQQQQSSGGFDQQQQSSGGFDQQPQQASGGYQQQQSPGGYGVPQESPGLSITPLNGSFGSGGGDVSGLDQQLLDAQKQLLQAQQLVQQNQAPASPPSIELQLLETQKQLLALQQGNGGGGSIRRRLDPGHHDSQRKGPDIPRPYLPEHLDKIMNMLLEVAERYHKDDVRLYHIMMGYYEKIREERIKLKPEDAVHRPPGGFY